MNQEAVSEEEVACRIKATRAAQKRGFAFQMLRRGVGRVLNPGVAERVGVWQRRAAAGITFAIAEENESLKDAVAEAIAATVAAEIQVSEGNDAVAKLTSHNQKLEAEVTALQDRVGVLNQDLMEAQMSLMELQAEP